MASLGSDIRAIVNAVQARLNGHPDSAEEWITIARQLRSASDKARKIHKLAERMETHETFCQTAATASKAGYVQHVQRLPDGSYRLSDWYDSSVVASFENGKKIAQGRGANSASATAGALGTETRIGVTVVAPDGASASTEASIIPTELDLVADSDSYTPPFYGGWPRPSAGTTLHLQSFP